MPRWSRGVLVSSFRATRCVGAAVAATTAFRVCHWTRAGGQRAAGEAPSRERERERNGGCAREGERASSVLEGKREEGDGAPVGYHTQHRASREPIAERRRYAALSGALSSRAVAVRVVLGGRDDAPSGVIRDSRGRAESRAREYPPRRGIFSAARRNDRAERKCAIEGW